MASNDRGDERDVGSSIDAELRFHFEERVEELTGAGVPAAEARRRAAEEFGDVEAVRSGLVEIDLRLMKRRRRRETVLLVAQDVRQAVRRLARSPGFAGAAVLTLALGIGAVTAVFGTVDAVALRPLPYAGAERLDGEKAENKEFFILVSEAVKLLKTRGALRKVAKTNCVRTRAKGQRSGPKGRSALRPSLSPSNVSIKRFALERCVSDNSPHTSIFWYRSGRQRDARVRL